MRSAAHEKKILENIERVAYCTECFEDYLTYSLIPYGKSWKYLCWKCYRSAIKQIRATDAPAAGKNSTLPKPKSEQ
jgi:hypothetical protein